MQAPPLPFLSRVAFAWVCFFRVLFDGAFAGRAWAARDSLPALPEPKERAAESSRPRASIDPPTHAEVSEPSGRSTKKRKIVDAKKDAGADPGKLREEGSLWILSVLQREGRLIDFLKQDVAAFSDDEVGAAVRVVHAGCRKALEEHVTIEPVRSEEEGAAVTLDEGFDKAAHKLVGDVRGSAPYRGVLRHKGWRAKDTKLPTPTAGFDASVLAAAEVEL